MFCYQCATYMCEIGSDLVWSYEKNGSICRKTKSVNPNGDTGLLALKWWVAQHLKKSNSISLEQYLLLVTDPIFHQTHMINNKLY